MHVSHRLLCALYVLTSTGLAWTAVLELLHGPVWAALLFAAASLVPVIAFVRETVLHDERRTVTALRSRAAAMCGRVDEAADEIVRAELHAACCERWWTSCGTDHDVSCPHRIPRSSAA
ncbi:hypothetical protein [Streptomyces sp. GESEQ-35]|uniref:hypothetical protein n=1 Tax=Streptomyces sp. GESEQ-35 TaxID=2812657 RepID=UPI001B32D3DD|nr:hypothetical protein [Streptomyces sp. GESEQ-35]